MDDLKGEGGSLMTKEAGSVECNGKQPLVPYWVKVVIVFFFGWVALYATRTILNPIMGDIESAFSLSKAQLGLIMSIFFIGYAGMNVPAGILGDKIGKKRVLVPGVILFGSLAAVTGMMPTFFLFISAWLMVGMAQGVYYGPQYGISSEMIPKNRLTLGSAVINAGMAFGTSIGYYISSYVVGEWGFGWRVPFFVIAVPVILIGITMAIVIKDKPTTDQEVKRTAEPFKFSSLFNRNLILAYIIIFCSIYGFFMIITWLPYYLETARGLTGGNIAFVASLVPWAAIPGSLFFSWLSDKLGRRKPVLLMMLPFGILSTAAIVYFDSLPILYMTLIVYGIVGKISVNPVLIAVVANNAPKQSLSTAFGFYNFVGMLGSILAPYITGWLTDTTGSMNIGFYFAAALLVIALIATYLIDESYLPSVDKAAKHH